MKFKKWMGLFLACAMLMVSLTGCLGHVFTKAMTVNGEEISAGMYLMLQMVAYGEAQGKVEDTTDILDQWIEDKKGIDWINDRTAELCCRLVAVEKLCAQKGITLSEENTEKLNSDMEYWDGVKEQYEQAGVGYETLKRYIQYEYLSEQLFDTLYGTEGEFPPSRDEIAAYYSERYAHVRLMLIPLSDWNGEELDNAQEIRDAADDMAEEIRAGNITIQEAALDVLPGIKEMATPPADEDEDEELDDIEEEIVEEEPVEEVPAEEEATTEGEEAEGEEGEEGEEEEPSEVEGITNYYLSYEPDGNGFFTKEFLDEVKEMKVGDVGTYEFQGTYMVFQIIDTFETDKEFEDVRDSVVSEMMKDAFDEYLKGVYSTYTVDKFPGAEWYLSPKKLVEAGK